MNLKTLESEGVDFRLTSSVTPPLAEMLADGVLNDKYRKFLDRTLELTNKEIHRTKDDPYFGPLARMYNERFERLKNFYYNDLQCNVLNGYRHFQDTGKLEIINTNSGDFIITIGAANVAQMVTDKLIGEETEKQTEMEENLSETTKNRDTIIKELITSLIWHNQKLYGIIPFVARETAAVVPDTSREGVLIWKK